VKLGGREYPTPLLLGGGAVVVAVAGIQLLRGGPQDAPAPAEGAPAQGIGQGGSPTGDGEDGDAWGQLPAGGAFPSAGGNSGWWDPGEPTSGGVNTQPPVTTLPPTPITPTPAPTSPTSPTSPAPTSQLVRVSAKAGSYKLYSVRAVGKQYRACESGSMTTGGFSGSAKRTTYANCAGTSTTTVVLMTSGVYAGRMFYARAPGITVR
jgi:hypothetical protein